MTSSAEATAFAPASIGNVGVGFDMLGLALCDVGDRVTVKRVGRPGITVAGVFGPDGEPHPDLPRNATQNTAAIAAEALWKAAGRGDGLELVVRKGIPLKSGMGSSAASAVAAAVATNALLEASLPTTEVLRCALEGERFASGGLHADNVAPSLMGGLILCPPALLPICVPLATPPHLSSVLVHPHLEIDTATSRRGLARRYSLEQWLAQQGFLAAFVAACEQQDLRLMRQSLQDVVIEPQRAHTVPCFAAVKAAALDADAIGCSLSGSGPSIFALCVDSRAQEISFAMQKACRACDIDCDCWISPIQAPGARLEAPP